MEKRIKIGVIGLGFGAEFIPIYQAHSNAEMHAICQRTKNKMDIIGNKFGIDKRYTSFDDLIKDDEIDAIHINTPIPLHAEQSIAALKAGQHVACTVPAATNMEDLQRIVNAQRESGKNT